MYIFSGKIKCKDCSSNFRGKTQRNLKVYICSGYHNKKSNCKRFLIKEKDIIEIINKHFEIENRYGDRNVSNPIDKVDHIEVFNAEEGYMIKYDDGEYSIVSKTHVKW